MKFNFRLPPEYQAVAYSEQAFYNDSIKARAPMYYRRKFLLALIESFGGSLNDTDCNKLVFLFCQKSGRHYYDFIPYKYGPFSHILFQDKLNLTRSHYLTDTPEFELVDGGSYLNQLTSLDQEGILQLKHEVGAARGRALVRRVYQQYPYFATRSQIAREILSPTDMVRVEQLSKTPCKPCLFSIGYEGISVDAYLNKLIAHNIKVLIDVRKNPLSMKYGFSKGQLQKYVENLHIAYFHIPDLGVASSLRQNLNSAESYAQLFSYYETSILPNHLDALDRIRVLLKQHKRVALTCFEAVHTSCHRHKITAYFEEDPAFDIPVVHL